MANTSVMNNNCPTPLDLIKGEENKTPHIFCSIEHFNITKIDDKPLVGFLTHRRASERSCSVYCVLLKQQQ